MMMQQQQPRGPRPQGGMMPGQPVMGGGMPQQQGGQYGMPDNFDLPDLGI